MIFLVEVKSSSVCEMITVCGPALFYLLSQPVAKTFLFSRSQNQLITFIFFVLLLIHVSVRLS